MNITINKKPLEIVATAGVSDKYGGIELQLYIKIILGIIQKHLYDMYVLEMCDENHFHIKLAGYNFKDGTMDETTIVYTSDKSLQVDKMYFKIDDYGDKYVGTFLFPSEW